MSIKRLSLVVKVKIYNLYSLKIKIPILTFRMDELLLLNMLCSPHSYGLAVLLCPKWLFCVQYVGVWWVLPTVGAALCTLQTPPTNTEQPLGVAATSGAASLPPAPIPPSGGVQASTSKQPVGLDGHYLASFLWRQ